MSSIFLVLPSISATSPASRSVTATAPASTREFVVAYDFDGLVGFNHARPLSDILDFARAANAKEIEIVGHRGAVLLSNGQTMVEDPAIGKKRAEQIAMLLQGANLKTPSYKVTWHDEPAKATGVDDYLSRRVVVTIRSK